MIGTMVIETLFLNKEGQWEPLREACRYENNGGWTSPEAYCRAKIRRSFHNPRTYRNGLELDGQPGIVQRVWFEEKTQ